MGPRVELKQEPVSPLIVIKNPESFYSHLVCSSTLPRVELKQEPVSPLIVIKNLWVILLTSGLFFDITTGLHIIVRLVQW